MRVLVVQNYDNTGLGQVGTALAEAGVGTDICRAYMGEALSPDATGHDALVILGGGQNALADDTHPYFPALLGLIRDFAARDKAVLGICLGSQLIARAFGGENKVGGATEFGWHTISLGEKAGTDAVLGALPERFSIFQWHDDTFSLPPGALRLASSEVAQNQAFRIGRAVYGFQFHFEADRALVRQWCDLYAPAVAVRHPGWAGRLDSEAARHGPQADAVGLAIARAWVAAI